MKINIFFETLNYEEIEEQPLMDVSLLISSIDEVKVYYQ